MAHPVFDVIALKIGMPLRKGITGGREEFCDLSSTRRKFYVFASLAKHAMGRGCVPAISRRETPELWVGWPPSEPRGRREDRVRAAPAVPCALLLGRSAHEHTGSAEAIRPSLRGG